jgi:hypothetical protein
MSGRAVVDVDELSPEVRRQLGIPDGSARSRRRTAMTKDEIRSAAIRVLAVVASLSSAQRRRVLKHALEVNEV